MDGARHAGGWSGLPERGVKPPKERLLIHTARMPRVGRMGYLVLVLMGLLTTTARAVSATVQARCGAGHYFVRGLHGHVRTGSTLFRYESFTDLAYND